MRVRVDLDRCEGNARCIGVAPNIIELDDSDQARVRMDDVPEEHRTLMEQAVRLCPRQAISVDPKDATGKAAAS